MKFFLFDFRHETVTEYARTGHCNQCGDCCKLADRINWHRYEPKEPETVEQLGSYHSGFNRMFRVRDGAPIWCKVIDDDGKVRYYEPHFFAPSDYEDRAHSPCEKFIDGHCAIQSEKYQVSKDWPYHPSQTDLPFGRCSYRFISLGQREMTDAERKAV